MTAADTSGNPTPPIVEPGEQCDYFKEHGAHERSSKDGPYRWKCVECGDIWYGPNY